MESSSAADGLALFGPSAGGVLGVSSLETCVSPLEASVRLNLSSRDAALGDARDSRQGLASLLPGVEATGLEAPALGGGEGGAAAGGQEAAASGSSEAKGEGTALPSEKVQVVALGAGCEVGRSCVVVKFEGFTAMFDCGVHPAHSGIGSLPLFDGEEMAQVDVCLITHFHLDHCGALPYLLTRTSFRGRVLMTQATRAVARLLWQDSARVGRFASDWSGAPAGDEGAGPLFTEADIDYALQVIETLDFRQQLRIGPARISCYGAGHVVGACMFLIEVNGVRVLYTGDFSREVDRHVPVAELPETQVHVLICESTYGVQVHEPRGLREKRLLRCVASTVERGGKVLLPVFALGRAQELLLILDEHWMKHKHLHKVPIYFVSPLSSKSMAVFEAFLDMCGEGLREKALQVGRGRISGWWQQSAFAARWFFPSPLETDARCCRVSAACDCRAKTSST